MKNRSAFTLETHKERLVIQNLLLCTGNVFLGKEPKEFGDLNHKYYKIEDGVIETSDRFETYLNWCFEFNFCYEVSMLELHKDLRVVLNRLYDEQTDIIVESLKTTTLEAAVIWANASKRRSTIKMLLDDLNKYF